MAVSVTHTFVSAIADDAGDLAAGKVCQQAHWNAAHTVTGALDAASNLSDLASAATARTNLGLGSAATTAATDYATAAQGATADGALAASANLSDVASAATARTNLGLGTAAESAATDFVAVAGDTMTGTLTSTLGTITADTPNWTGTATWNNAGVTFTGIKYNVTDTASNAASLLADLQVGGVSQFSVKKNGSIFIGSNALEISQSGYAINIANNLSVSGVSAYGTAVDGSKILYVLGATGKKCLYITNNSGIPIIDVDNDTKQVKINWVLLLEPKTVANLGAAGGVASGARQFVNDSTVPGAGNFGAVVVGGGTDNVPVYYDGTNWRIG